MSQDKVGPLHDRSNSRSPPRPSSPHGNVGHKSSSRYALYPTLSSSEVTPSSHSSVYDASLYRSADEEQKIDSGCQDSIERRHWRSWGRRKKKEKTAPSVDPPSRPPAPNNAAIVEIRFKNRPQGTPLTTIVERKSSTSLRRRISDISAKRNFTPVRVESSPK